MPALAVILAMPAPASAATITASWQAKLGSGGVNGTVRVVSYLGGTGAATIKLARLKPSTLLPVVIYKGTCSVVGTKVATLASIRTTSSGAATRTSALTAAQASVITRAAAAGRLVIRVGSGTTAKCGALAAQAIAPYVAATITVGPNPLGVAIAPNGVWVTNWWGNSLSRVDPATNTVLQTVPLTISGTGGPEAIAFGEGSLWVTVTDFDANNDPLAGSVLRVDPTSGLQVATIPVGKGAYDIEAAGGAVWVGLLDDSAVTRIDPATNAVATIPMGANVTGLTVGLGSLWVADGTGKVSRIDPATNQVSATVQTQDTGGYITVAPNAVWVSNPGHENAADGRVTRIDPATNTVVGSVVVGSHPFEIAYAGGSVWVALEGAPTVVQVSAATGAVVNRVTVAHSVYALTAGEHVVWAVQNLPAPDANSDPPNGAVVRISF